MTFYADVQLARAAALNRLGKKTEARRVLDKAMASAKPERRKGLKAGFRRFVVMCRKIDQHWKKQGRKPLVLR